ncbi:MAG TPA: outer membrane beta-barrel protein [Burkholderiales bacterium]|nr:outer membrane beta-barrel protein [Burkholderiales bacterium]
MKLATVCGAAAVLGMLSLPVAAQAPQPTMYWNEVSVFGSWDNVREPADVEVTQVHLRYGRMVQPQLAALLGLSRSRFQAPGADNTTTTFTVGAKYYFQPLRAQAVVPFAEGAIGFANTDARGTGDSTDFTWELGGGAAFFLTERTSVDASIRLYSTATEVRTEGTRFFLGLTTRF